MSCEVCGSEPMLAGRDGITLTQHPGQRAPRDVPRGVDSQPDDVLNGVVTPAQRYPSCASSGGQRELYVCCQAGAPLGRRPLDVVLTIRGSTGQRSEQVVVSNRGDNAWPAEEVDPGGGLSLCWLNDAVA